MRTTPRHRSWPRSAARLPAGLERYLDLASRMTYEKGQFLFTQGESDHRGLWWLESGQVKFSLLTDDGLERVVAFAGEGSIFGEDSVVTEEGHLVTCQAVTDVVISFFEFPTIVEAMKRDPSLAVELLEVLAHKLRYSVRLIEEMSFLGVKERVAHALVRLSVGDATPDAGRTTPPEQLDPRPVRLSQQELANLVGASRVMVAHALAELKREGAIDKHRRYLVVRDLDRLMGSGRSPRTSRPH